MANEHQIDINKRDNTGKKGVKQLRREGNIPGVYYSPTSESSTPIFITQREYHEAVKSGEATTVPPNPQPVLSYLFSFFLQRNCIIHSFLW